MHEKLKKPYDHKDSGGRIYEAWEKSGYFSPERCIDDGVAAADAPTFSIVLPPPNVTGTLHMGSALMLVIEDTMVRHARMRGKRTMWIPGTDSAAIATQAVVEKNIQKKEGKNRYDLGREELLKRIDAFVEENKGTILKQIRAIGASVDWSRYAYTMDKPRYEAVMTAFVRMHEAGLIYRGNRVVNWDPKGQTVISDDEIEYAERDAMLYTFRYWKDFPILISTTRPETKVGDTAVAVHPDDERYKKFVGKVFEGEFAGSQLTIKIIADPSVEKDFGTGALGVTPAHSHADWDIAERHGVINRPQVIDERARMTERSGSLVVGLKTLEAREKIVAWLRNEGLLEKEEVIKQNVSVAQRTGGIVEPLPKLQWFIDVEKPFTIQHSEIDGIPSGSQTTLKEIMRRAVDGGQIKILPDRFEKNYFHWIDNLRPWCISRQIWFGHRIPVWYSKTIEPNAPPQSFIGIKPPDGGDWEQDPDVLDTWFSSALWTFSTLGWPEKTKSLETYHPTALLETGYDILFFWVARMILMSGFHLGQIPFRTVYLHGLIRDMQGRKISKSLGNNIDPVAMSEKYGTDAVRVSLVAGTAAGADSKLSEDKIKGYKHFANKLWNISRFILENSEGLDLDTKPQLTPDDQNSIAQFSATAKTVTEHMENYRLHLATEELYAYLWHTFADKIIEGSKPILRGEDMNAKTSRQWTLLCILENSLKLLHPLMPFITEELWGMMPCGAMLPKQKERLLMVEAWPTGNF